MNKNIAVLAIFLLLLTTSFTTFACTISGGGCSGGGGYPPTGGGGCGGGGGVGCTPTETYNKVLTTTTFTDVGWFTNKQTFSFDAIETPGEGFEIESVFLTVNTNSNGIGDSIWAYTDAVILPWDFVGSLSDNDSDEFSLDESLFDLVMSGITFKAWFSCCLEDITLATLTINGVYCDSRPVPLPGAVWLFGSAFAGLLGFSKRRKGQS